MQHDSPFTGVRTDYNVFTNTNKGKQIHYTFHYLTENHSIRITAQQKYNYAFYMQDM